MAKILMILDREFPPDIRVENEIQALVLKGHDVHLACYTRKDKPELEKTNGFTIHRKPISDFIYKSSVAALTLPFYFSFWKEFIDRLITTENFDVIHIHDLPLVSMGLWAKKNKNVKLICDLHENWPAFLVISKHTKGIKGRLLSPVFLWRQYEKKKLKNADAIIVVVNEAKTRLAGLMLNPDKIHVVSNTINLNEINLPQPAPHNDIILYYAGGINYHRGLQDIISAIAASGNPRIKFQVLGDGSYQDELIKLTTRLGVNDQVIFHGFKPFKIVMEMMSQADFAVIPHLKSEHTDSTIPHKLFQYMFAGKPVIASNCLPIERIITETGSGIVYASASELAGIFGKLNELDYKRMASNGIKAVTEKYNWNVDSNVLVNVYHNLLDN